MSARSIVEALGGSWRGSRGMALCPAHNDRTPSLSVTQTSSGKILVRCFAGCSQDAVIQALRDRNLWSEKQRQLPLDHTDDEYTRLRRARAVFRPAPGPDKSTVARYLKTRAILLPIPSNLYEVSAHVIKLRGLGHYPALVAPVQASADGGFTGAHVTFLRRDGCGKAKRDPDRILLGPTKGGVVKFGQGAEGPLLIGEGLEEALTVHQITGYESWAALSAPNMGAITLPTNKIEIIVCANNDETGLKSAHALAERAAKSGKIARVAIPTHEGADWNDLICDDKADLQELRLSILEAPIVSAPSKTGLTVVSAIELAQLDLPPRVNLLSPWLPRQGLAMIHAPRGVGKTYLALGIAFAVTQGEPFLSWTVEASGEVLYLDGEMPASLMQERVRAFQSLFTKEPNHELRLVSPDFQDSGMPDLSTDDGQERIDKIVSDQTALIIVDSISTLVRTGDENTADDWLPVQMWALRHRAAGRSVLFVHHSGKSGQQRGTSRREDVLDTVINLRRPENYGAEEGAVFQVHFEKARGLYGPDAAAFEAQMHFDADLGMDWNTRILGASRLERVVEMINKGETQKDIAASLEISEGRVSQLAKKARESGLLETETRQKTRL